ncbi:hypothetical protein CEXT_116491 [Caerostris extrusa]|uniref:Uncharacterized protein n=1 Tax=Caerostris extrusa TaxID=172846 RepID=A0AAV4VDJ5_CAEEX|nr:hypothetical protein CEXT_116491 [Caerostris extrusa]
MDANEAVPTMLRLRNGLFGSVGGRRSPQEDGKNLLNPRTEPVKDMKKSIPEKKSASAELKRREMNKSPKTLRE